MGLTVTEQYELNVGLVVDSYYISLNENDIHIQRHRQSVEFQDTLPIPKFRVGVTFNIWVSKAARDANNRNIGSKYIYVDLDAAPTGNIYELLYNKLKEGLTNYVEA